MFRNPRLLVTWLIDDDDDGAQHVVGWVGWSNEWDGAGFFRRKRGDGCVNDDMVCRERVCGRWWVFLKWSRCEEELESDCVCEVSVK